MELRKITHTTLRLEATDGPFNLANVQTQKMAPVISKVSKIEAKGHPVEDRRRWASTLSLATLRKLEDENTHEDIVPLAESRAAWAKIITRPISSIKKKKRRVPMIKNHFNGVGSIAALFGNIQATMIIPNGPDRSSTLGMPLEAMEDIYGLLLTNPKPVFVGEDWQSVQGQVLKYNALQYVCKQIGDEALKFVDSHNVFVAMLREERNSSTAEKSVFIDRKFLQLFRNVVANCPMENWGLYWLSKAALSVSKLVEAQAILTSLTIVVTPSLESGSTPPAIRFADFFEFNSPLMTSICRLNLKALIIVVKKSIKSMLGNVHFTTGSKRLVTSVDLTHLHAGTAQNPMAYEKAVVVEDELRGLKHRFEGIFEDHEKALHDGICRELGEDETIADGIALGQKK